MKKSFKTYYAVIFTSTQDEAIEGYAEMSLKMTDLAKQQPGYLGMDSVRNDTSTSLSGTIGITVSYWESLEAIKNWKQQSEHLEAQKTGRNQWYNWYKVRICKVEHDYEFLK